MVFAATAFAAEEPKVRKDAAEAVQEGNVQNWVEYYQRTRPPPPPAAPASATAPAVPKQKDPPDPSHR